MHQCSKKLVTYKEYSCFDHSDFPTHSMFTFDACWDRLGTSIFGNSSSAASNTRSRLTSRLSFRFLWLYSRWLQVILESFSSLLLLVSMASASTSTLLDFPCRYVDWYRDIGITPSTCSCCKTFAFLFILLLLLYIQL